jgi:hypothetical protein
LIVQPKQRISTLSWALVVLYALWDLGLKRSLAHYLPPFTGQLLIIAFFVSHALGYYSWRTVAFYAFVSALVSNVFENLSVLYGFPFGYYVHNSGPKLFNVPYGATLAYVGLGYVSWMVTQALVRRTGYRSWNRLVYVAPLIAAFVFTIYDFCVDPIGGTVYRAFVYRNPGPWFGTPTSNYFGWLLTTYLFFLPLSLYLRNRGEAAGKTRVEPGSSYWLQPILIYLTVAVGDVLDNLRGKSVDVTLVNGRVWNSGDIWGALNLATLFTMVFISLLALVTLYGSGEVPDEG